MKQMMVDLKEAKERAEENERLKTAFLANMSHEIRTPLNGILGFTELLTGEMELTVDQKEEFKSIIRQSSDSLLQIINDVLDISRLESGQIQVNPASFNVHELLNALYKLYEKKLADKGKTNVELFLELPDFEIEVIADEGRLRQVFTNLLDNAVKFTENGHIIFGISQVTESNIRFKVEDTGMGIPKDKQNIIFDRFSQADETISAKHGGTGLGLAIVRKLTELMGNGIDMDSGPGNGTRFTFEIPGKVVK
jgi:signal transduction histidine kinase